jgi:predicted site-specific integrase-resolvase
MKISEAFEGENSSLKKVFDEWNKQALELSDTWEIEFDEKYYNKNLPSGLNTRGFKFQKQMIDDVKSFISSLLAKQQEEFVKIVERVEKVNDSNGRYNACQEILADIKSKLNKEEPAYIGGVNLTTNDNEISSRLAVEDKLQTEFMEFWDEYKPKVGLGDYSDEITRFWFEKMETQKAEIISLIMGMANNNEILLLDCAKIVNKIRNETN